MSSQKPSGDNDQEPKKSPQEMVDQWVERSGASLELRVLRYLRQKDYRARLSMPFVDPVTGKIREGDVIGVRSIRSPAADRHLLGRLNLAVECKHSGGNLPWVSFTDARSSRVPNTSWWSPVQNRMDEILEAAGPMPTGSVGWRISEATDRSNDPAHDAVRQVLNWARSFRGKRYVNVVIPVVVTTHALFTAHLDATSAEVITGPTRWVGVRMPKPPTDAGTVTGEHVVHIVHESGLPEFTAAVNRLFAGMLDATGGIADDD